MTELLLTPSQMRWRCRRGVRELDVLFNQFLDTQYDDLPKSEKHAFQKLLSVQDPTIMDWLFGKEEVSDLGLVDVIRVLQLVSGAK